MVKFKIQGMVDYIEGGEGNIIEQDIIFEGENAIKGPDYIHLLNDSGNIQASFEGTSDFSGYELIEGEWSDPTEQEYISEREALTIILGGASV